jgi:hypothetical protein
MIAVMPLLNGPRVRHLAAERGWDLPTLAERAATHPRTLTNVTRQDSPQPASLRFVYALAGALAYGTDQDPRDIAASIVADDDVAAEIRAAKETEQPKREPTGPAKRQEKTSGNGPKRATAEAAVA